MSPKRGLNRLLQLPFVRYSLFGALYQNGYSERDKMLEHAMRYTAASGLTGDYFEFGVYTGGTFIGAYHAARRLLPKMRFYAFDSFEGLPSNSGKDLPVGESDPFHKGQFAAPEKTFLGMLRKRGVDTTLVTTVPGWYDEVLTDETKKKLAAQKVAVAYIDCDLYESTVPVLEFLTSYLEDGSLLLFDDWFCYRGDPSRGEQRAFREWQEKHPEFSVVPYQTFAWSGNSFIVHKHHGS